MITAQGIIFSCGGKGKGSSRRIVFAQGKIEPGSMFFQVGVCVFCENITCYLTIGLKIPVPGKAVRTP